MRLLRVQSKFVCHYPLGGRLVNVWHVFKITHYRQKLVEV